jgi:hypothetical protein
MYSCQAPILPGTEIRPSSLVLLKVQDAFVRRRHLLKVFGSQNMGIFCSLLILRYPLSLPSALHRTHTLTPQVPNLFGL